MNTRYILLLICLTLASTIVCQITTTAEVVAKISTNSGIYGTILVTSDKRALYIHSIDMPNMSNCNTECQKTLVPYTVDTKDSIKTETTTTLNASFGYLEVSGTAKYHVTFGEWPLYTYKPSTGTLSDFDISAQGMIVNNAGAALLINEDGRPITALGEISTPVVGNGAVLTLSSASAYGAKYLADKDGIVLYVFSGDGFRNVTCKNDCLTDFPAYEAANGSSFFETNGSFKKTTKGINVGTGLDAQLASVVKFNTGTGSSTSTKYAYSYNGLPLYYNTNEKTKETSLASHQGVTSNGGKWWLIQADGRVNIQTTKDSTTPTHVEPNRSDSKKQLGSSFLTVSFALLAIIFGLFM